MTASMSSTANMTRRRPSTFTGASTGPNLIASGVWNLSSSMRPWPSGVRMNTRVARTPSSPIRLSTEGPSTCASPSSSSPRSMKNDLVASRSSTTMRTLSIRRIVMCLSPGVVCCPGQRPSPDERSRPGILDMRSRLLSSAHPAVPDVCGQRRMQDLDGLEPERLDAVEYPLAGAKQNRRDVERQLVDDAGHEGLAHGRGAARDVYAALAGCLMRLRVSSVEAAGD